MMPIAPPQFSNWLRTTKPPQKRK